MPRGSGPRSVAEFDDSALLKVFGQSGMAVFPTPSVTAQEVQEQCRVEPVGAVDEIRER